jgi:hypothetical protein
MDSENLPVKQRVSDDHKLTPYSSPVPPSECLNDPRAARVIEEPDNTVIEIIYFEVAIFGRPGVHST